MKKYIFLLSVAFVFICCSKDESHDYREPFKGEFNFTTVKSTIMMCLIDTPPDCIDGWKILRTDTSYITSLVSDFEKERLIIMFGEDGEIIGATDNDSLITRTIFPIITEDGILELPEYPDEMHNRFYGSFIGYDTIAINLVYGYNSGGFDKYEISAVRNN